MPRETQRRVKIRASFEALCEGSMQRRSSANIESYGGDLTDQVVTEYELCAGGAFADQAELQEIIQRVQDCGLIHAKHGGQILRCCRRLKRQCTCAGTRCV